MVEGYVVKGGECDTLAEMARSRERDGVGRVERRRKIEAPVDLAPKLLDYL